MARNENLGKSLDFAYIPGTAMGQACARCVQGKVGCAVPVSASTGSAPLPPAGLQSSILEPASVPWYFVWLLSSVICLRLLQFHRRLIQVSESWRRSVDICIPGTKMRSF